MRSIDYSFNIEAAVKYGVEEAIFIKNLCFWITKNKANDKHFIDGRTWTYNSAKALQKLFPFWTSRQIERIIKSLVKKKVIFKGKFNKTKYDHTTWFAFVNEEEFLPKLLNSEINADKDLHPEIDTKPLKQSISPFGEIGFTKLQNRSNQTVKSISDNNTDNKHIYNISESKLKKNASNGEKINKEKLTHEKKVKKEINEETSNEDLTSFINALKQNPIYKHINIDREIQKMEIWLSAGKHRKKTKRFILSWLNRVKTPLDGNTSISSFDDEGDNGILEKIKREVRRYESCSS